MLLLMAQLIFRFAKFLDCSNFIYKLVTTLTFLHFRHDYFNENIFWKIFLQMVIKDATLSG